MRPAPRAVPFAAALAAGLALTACPPDNNNAASCGDPAAFDLTSCNPIELNGVVPAGVWHGKADLDAGTSLVIVGLTDPAAPMINAIAADHFQLDGGGFFLSDSYTYSNSSHVYRLAFAGCHSTGAGNVSGYVQQCSDGKLAQHGTFDMTRVVRNAGEGEASNVTLVSETLVTQGTPQELWLSGTHAFVSAGEGGMTIFDISDPAAPRAIAQIHGPTLGQNDYFYDARVRGNTMYVASYNSGVLIWDITNPASPFATGSQPSPATQVRNLFLDDSNARLYASAPQRNAVFIFDVSSPSPILLGTFTAQNPTQLAGVYPQNLFASGNRLYVNYGPLGYVVVDVGNPAAPTQIGPPTAPDGAASYASALAAIGGRTYAFESGYGWDGHVRALDVTDPTAVSAAGTYRVRPEVSAGKLDADGTTLYVAEDEDGLRVVDVTNPAAPAEHGYFNSWRETDPNRGYSFYEGLVAVRAAKDGSGLVYGADTSRGLLVFRAQ